MAPLTTSALPLLPLDAGVVLPGHDHHPRPRDARGPRRGRGRGGRRRPPRAGAPPGPDRRARRRAGPLRPGRDGRPRRARAARCPAARPAVVVQAARAGHRRGRDRGRRARPVGQRRHRRGAAAPTERRAARLARELRAVFEAIAEHRGVGRLAEMSCAASTDPARWPTPPATGPSCRSSARSSCSRRSTVERRVELVLAWAREALAELELKDRIRTDVAEGMERTQREYLLRQQLAAIRKELGEDGDGEDSRRLPDPAGGPATLPEATRTAITQGDRQAGAHQRAEPRARLDPHLARHRVRAAVGRAVR